MSVNAYKSRWMEVFEQEGFTAQLASSEFDEWVSGLDGEMDNEWNQTGYSVHCAAVDAVAELKKVERYAKRRPVPVS